MRIQNVTQHTFPGEECYLQIIDGCVIIYNPMPLSMMQAASKLAGKKAVMDIGFGQRIGAMVIGTPSNLKKLRTRKFKYCESYLRDAEAASQAGKKELAHWILEGDRGTSSNVLANAIFGIPSVKPSDNPSTPSDADDFNRCVKMLGSTGVGKDHALAAMRTISPSWARITNMYDDLLAALEHDIANKTDETRTLLASIDV